MDTIYRNPYQTSLTTEITQRKYEGDTTHIRTADTLFFDATSLHLMREHGTLSGLPLVRTYQTTQGLVHVVSGRPQQSRLTMQLDWNDRNRNLRESTMRFLLRMALHVHYNRTPFGFRLSSQGSSCQINGAFTEEETLAMQSHLQEVVERYVRMGLEISTREYEKDKAIERITEIDPLFTTPFFGPHLHLTSEVYRFEILSVERTGQGAKISYRLL